MTKTLATLVLSVSFVATAEVPAKRLNSAATVLSEVMSAPDKGIPSDLLARAQCIVIVPGLKGGAFGFGGSFFLGPIRPRVNPGFQQRDFARR